MMKKRLRYTMPHVQLYKHKPEEEVLGERERQNRVTTHVADIANRIVARERKRRRIQPQPGGAWGGAWGGDIETSESEFELDNNDSELGSDEEDDYV